MNRVVHLTASRVYGGPERQILGLARELAPDWRTTIVSFPENGCCEAFLQQVRDSGLEGRALAADMPHLLAAVRELTGLLRELDARVLCCHGYKADLLGQWAARRAGIPVVGVSRGWTWENWKVRLYEALDRMVLRRMDRVVCVSHGQAEKVRRAGVRDEKIRVIANSIDARRFGHPEPAARALLQSLFPAPRTFIVGAAGRLSPEKGFDVLLDAARVVAKSVPRAGIVIFGEGPLRPRLQSRIDALRLGANLVLAGFRPDLDRLMPALDMLVLPSFTEGMPNVVLEAMAAGLPVVATAVGGTPELVEDGSTGWLTPAGDVAALARRLIQVLGMGPERRTMGQRGRDRVLEHFTFAAQARQYRALFAELGIIAEPARRPLLQPTQVG